MRGTYGRGDPIAAARGEIERKVQRLQEEILGKCGGTQRKVLRTLEQLLMTEPTIQGKIQRLISIADSLPYRVEEEEECEMEANQMRQGEVGRKELVEKYRYLEEMERQCMKDSCKPRQSAETVNQFTQYSPKFSKSPHERTATQNSQSQDREISMQASASNSSFSNFSNHTPSQHSPVLLKQPANDQNIFSFRTQPTSLQPNRPSYDGVSLAYNPQNPEKSESIKEQRAKKETVRKQMLLEKIRKRIKLSSCVVGPIEHTSSGAEVAGLLRRVELQRGLRRGLIGEMEGAGWK